MNNTNIRKAVVDSVSDSVRDSVSDSVGDYFQTNSHKIKQ
jgi:hypothetical protein